MRFITASQKTGGITKSEVARGNILTERAFFAQWRMISRGLLDGIGEKCVISGGAVLRAATTYSPSVMAMDRWQYNVTRILFKFVGAIPCRAILDYAWGDEQFCDDGLKPDYWTRTEMTSGGYNSSFNYKTTENLGCLSYAETGPFDNRGYVRGYDDIDVFIFGTTNECMQAVHRILLNLDKVELMRIGRKRKRDEDAVLVFVSGRMVQIVDHRLDVTIQVIHINSATLNGYADKCSAAGVCSAAVVYDVAIGDPCAIERNQIEVWSCSLREKMFRKQSRDCYSRCTDKMDRRSQDMHYLAKRYDLECCAIFIDCYRMDVFASGGFLRATSPGVNCNLLRDITAPIYNESSTEEITRERAAKYALRGVSTFGGDIVWGPLSDHSTIAYRANLSCSMKNRMAALRDSYYTSHRDNWNAENLKRLYLLIEKRHRMSRSNNMESVVKYDSELNRDCDVFAVGLMSSIMTMRDLFTVDWKNLNDVIECIISSQ